VTVRHACRTERKTHTSNLCIFSLFVRAARAGWRAVSSVRVCTACCAALPGNGREGGNLTFAEHAALPERTPGAGIRVVLLLAATPRLLALLLFACSLLFLPAPPGLPHLLLLLHLLLERRGRRLGTAAGTATTSMREINVAGGRACHRMARTDTQHLTACRPAAARRCNIFMAASLSSPVPSMVAAYLCAGRCLHCLSSRAMLIAVFFEIVCGSSRGPPGRKPLYFFLCATNCLRLDVWYTELSADLLVHRLAAGVNTNAEQATKGGWISWMKNVPYAPFGPAGRRPREKGLSALVPLRRRLCRRRARGHSSRCITFFHADLKNICYDVLSATIKACLPMERKHACLVGVVLTLYGCRLSSPLSALRATVWQRRGSAAARLEERLAARRSGGVPRLGERAALRCRASGTRLEEQQRRAAGKAAKSARCRAGGNALRASQRHWATGFALPFRIQTRCAARQTRYQAAAADAPIRYAWRRTVRAALPAGGTRSGGALSALALPLLPAIPARWRARQATAQIKPKNA